MTSAPAERREIVVSAIIAVYNPNLFYFDQAVASVLNQSYRVHELVLVNDGGSEQFRSRLPDDSRIRVFTKENEGVAATRNFAIGKCSGDYIAFLDQDDFWYSDKLHEQLSMIPFPGAPCMVISTVDIAGSEDYDVHENQKRAHKKRIFLQATSESALLNLAAENFIYSSTPLIHRSVLTAVGGFDSWSAPHDDWDLYLRVVLAGYRIYFYRDKSLSVWRRHEENSSGNARLMLYAKCRVEQNLLHSTLPPAVRNVVNKNLLIDYVKRDHMLYKEHRYSRFRKMILLHLPMLMKGYGVTTGAGAERDSAFNRQIRKITFKSVIRYLLSFILQARV